jgi:hypothetical protein
MDGIASALNDALSLKMSLSSTTPSGSKDGRILISLGQRNDGDLPRGSNEPLWIHLSLCLTPWSPKLLLIVTLLLRTAAASRHSDNEQRDCHPYSK